MAKADKGISYLNVVTANSYKISSYKIHFPRKLDYVHTFVWNNKVSSCWLSPNICFQECFFVFYGVMRLCLIYTVLHKQYNAGEMSMDGTSCDPSSMADIEVSGDFKTPKKILLCISTVKLYIIFSSMRSILRNHRFRRDARTLEDEEEMWFNADEDDLEDGEAVVPPSDKMKSEEDLMEPISKFMERKKCTYGKALFTLWGYLVWSSGIIENSKIGMMGFYFLTHLFFIYITLAISK